jgi:hypothetical protein
MAGVAKLNSKSVDKGGGDLHEKKDSHLSTPADKGLEWHIRTDDLESSCQIGKNYFIVTPVVCTSMDDEATRFRQIGKPMVKNLKEST